jgi:protein arginine N-methyltransferase 3
LSNDFSDDDDDADNGNLEKRLQMLENDLALAQQSLLEHRNYVKQRLDLPTAEEAGPSESLRDDDAHYFDSYAEHGTSGGEKQY